MEETEKITIRKPIDAHAHVRDGNIIKKVCGFCKSYSHVVVMGNLPKPIETVQEAINYRKQIEDYAQGAFEPLMTIMLTRNTTIETIKEAHAAGIKIIKYMPAGISTNSRSGIPLPSLLNYRHLFKAMSKLGMVLSGHWESNHDIYSEKYVKEAGQEKAAIPRVKIMAESFPEMKIVVEHVTTAEMVDVVCNYNNLAATITAHHLILNYQDVADEQGEIIQPLFYCKPIAKTIRDREALIEVATSGSPQFFFGSDSAPHELSRKKDKPYAAGLFTHPVSLQILAQTFEEKNCLDMLEDFTSTNAAEFYGLTPSKKTITLVKEPWIVPADFAHIPIFMGGEVINWLIK